VCMHRSIVPYCVNFWIYGMQTTSDVVAFIEFMGLFKWQSAHLEAIEDVDSLRAICDEVGAKRK
jgi:hypothetical protein